MAISVDVFTNGVAQQSVASLEQISELLERPGELLWIDVANPTPDELATIQREFGFHPLAMEDVAKPHQRPKVDFYDRALLIFFYAVSPSANAGDGIALTQIGIFVGQKFVVTVHNAEVAALLETRERLLRTAGIMNNGPELSTELLLYSVLDAIVDSYFPVLDNISDRLEALEDRIIERLDTSAQQEIFRLKRTLVAIRRVVGPERDVLNVLLRREAPVFGQTMALYFQDIYDHVLRVTDAVDTYRDLLTSALEFHLAVASNRLNQIMKTLTASSIILMSMTLVASVYGMNFRHMPELDWRLGYAWALGLMTSIGLIVLAIFRRIRWL